MTTKPPSRGALCVCVWPTPRGPPAYQPKENGQQWGLPGQALGFSPWSRPWGHMTELQATHKGFLNSLSWPTLNSINA